jgi:hypothetical protein
MVNNEVGESLFSAELADLGHNYGLELTAYTIVGRPCLHHCIYFTCEEVFLAHLELHTTVLLGQLLLHLPCWIGSG